MSGEIIDILTPVGRMVQGDPFTPNTKNMKGGPLTDKQGNPKVNYFVALAIPKQDPGFAAVWAKMAQAAQRDFPQGQYNSPSFKWKLIDGDGMDSTGKPYSNREGFKGCYVLRFQSSFAPKCYTAGGASLLTDKESIKRGYYIRIYGTTSGNGDAQQPGIYMNLNLVELIGYGPEIISGPDGATVFGGTPAGQLPPGASPTPIAGVPLAQHPGTPPMPGYPQPQAPMPGYPQPQMPGYPAPTGVVVGYQPPAYPQPQVQPHPQPYPQAGAYNVPVPGMPPMPGPVGYPQPGIPAAPYPGIMVPPIPR